MEKLLIFTGAFTLVIVGLFVSLLVFLGLREMVRAYLVVTRINKALDVGLAKYGLFYEWFRELGSDYYDHKTFLNGRRFDRWGREIETFIGA